jgi:protein tyrosine/serine phosphatase
MLRVMLIAICLSLPLRCAVAEESNVVVRPSTWAKPLELEGVPNLYKVSDRLYRSAQPTMEGFRNLKGLGVKTVLNLRSFNSDRRELEDVGLNYQHLFVKAWHPEEKEVARFLRLVMDESRGPVLVHCQHGADRTGLMCAVYRVAVQNWTKDAALKEMTGGEYNFHGMWENLLKWFNKLDIECIRKTAGLTGPAR